MSPSTSLTTLLERLVKGTPAEGELDQNFASQMINAIEGMGIRSSAELAARASIIDTFVRPKERGFDPEAFARLTGYLKDLREEGADAPPPSRLGARSIADLVGGRVHASEFAEVLSWHLKMRASALGLQTLAQLPMFDLQRFLSYASGETSPEIYPLVGTVASVLGMNAAAGEQLGLAWIARTLPHSIQHVFAGGDGGNPESPAVRRLEALVAAVALRSGSPIPQEEKAGTPAAFARALLDFVKESDFDRATVRRTFSEALPDLADRYAFGFAVADAAFLNAYLPSFRSPLWEVLPEKARAIPRPELLERLKYKWLREALRLDLHSRYAERWGSPAEAGRYAHRTGKMLLATLYKTGRHEVLERLCSSMLARASSLYGRVPDALRARNNVSGCLESLSWEYSGFASYRKYVEQGDAPQPSGTSSSTPPAPSSDAPAASPDVPPVRLWQPFGVLQDRVDDPEDESPMSRAFAKQVGRQDAAAETTGGDSGVDAGNNVDASFDATFGVGGADALAAAAPTLMVSIPGRGFTPVGR